MWTPILEAGDTVLVAPADEGPAWRCVVDLVQDDRITLATTDGEKLPRDWRQLDAVHLTCVGRFSIYLIHVPVVRSGETRLVVGAPQEHAVQRRAYARVSTPVPVQCAVLEREDGTWSTFAAEVRDLGGGGCAFLADFTPEAGVPLSMAFDVDAEAPLVTVGRVLPRDELPAIGKPLTRVEFVLIRESDRDRIMRFVLFSLARQRRAKLRAAVKE
jgi:hypothetical protein